MVIRAGMEVEYRQAATGWRPGPEPIKLFNVFRESA